MSTTSDCTAQKTTFIQSTMRHGRTAAVTRAFEQCVEQALRVGLPAHLPDPFGGINGAGGTGVISGWPFPLPTASDFSLIGSFPDGLFANGVDGWRDGPSSTQRLSLRVNDWWPNNGSGFFEATARAFR